MSAGMVVMNYCSWVPIRRAYDWEVRAYERELSRIALLGGVDLGVVDGKALAPDLEGLRVMLVPTEGDAA